MMLDGIFNSYLKQLLSTIVADWEKVRKREMKSEREKCDHQPRHKYKDFFRPSLVSTDSDLIIGTSLSPLTEYTAHNDFLGDGYSSRPLAVPFWTLGKHTHTERESLLLKNGSKVVVVFFGPIYRKLPRISGFFFGLTSNTVPNNMLSVPFLANKPYRMKPAYRTTFKSLYRIPH